MIRQLLLPALLAVTGLALGVPAQAQNFAGKTMTIVVPYDAGGSTDIEARTFAKYLPEHLPGKPNIIVKNQPGAGGMTGVNFVGEVAEPDGLNMVMWTWNPVAHLLKEATVRVPMDKYRMVGGLQFGNIGFIRTDVKPGMKAPADIVKAEKFWFGGLAASNFKDLLGRLQLDILNTKYEYLTGYKGTADLNLAIQKDEIQFTTVSQNGWTTSVKPQMVDKGMVIPVFQTGNPTESASVRHPDFPDIPTLDELHQQLYGKAPSGPKWDMYRLLVPMRGAMTDVVWLPPKTPDNITNTIRKAFEDTIKDPNFQAEYKKVTDSKAVWVSGVAGQKILDSLGTVNEATLKQLGDYIAIVDKNKK
jgi:tripartite-type tricarboxylate transporter receptor subunit TctC